MPDAILTIETNRRALRVGLSLMLRTDPDVDAFCLDYVPAVQRRFSRGMDRLSKVNLLLELVEMASVVQALRAHIRGDAEAEALLMDNLRGMDTPEARQTQALRDELERLYREREQKRLSSEATPVLHQRIVEIKRKMRRGPQLSGDEVLNDRYRLLEVSGKGGFAKV